MRKYGHYLVGVTAICAFVLTFTPTTLSEAVGGPKHFTGELEGHTYTSYEVEFQSDKYAVFKADFVPKYQKKRSEIDCRNFEISLFDEKGNWKQTAGGSYRYVEDKERGEEVIRCEAQVGSGRLLQRNETFTIKVTNKNEWLATYTIDTN